MLAVQWYPGHMTRARRKLSEQLKTIDVIIELRDARIPLASGNPDLNELTKDKARVLLLNKEDLAGSEETEKWLSYFKEEGYRVLSIKGTDRKWVKKFNNLMDEVREEVFAKRRSKGLLNRPLRCMVIGISNVGKSSIINTMAGKKAAATGDRPGVTKGNQWISLRNGIELLDTPGILWPKFEGEYTGFYLAVTGAVSDLVYDIVEAALLLVPYLSPYREEDPMEVLTAFGRKRGFLQKGGEVDLEKSAFLFIKEYRLGKFGRVTLEAFHEEDIES